MSGMWQDIQLAARQMRKAGLTSPGDPFTHSRTLRLDISAKGVNICQAIDKQLVPIESVNMKSWEDTINYVAGILPEKQAQFPGHYIICSVWPDHGHLKDQRVGDNDYSSVQNLEMLLQAQGDPKLVENGSWFSVIRMAKDLKLFTFDAPKLAEIQHDLINLIVVPGPLAAFEATKPEMLPGLITICLYDGENVYYLYLENGVLESLRRDNLMAEINRPNQFALAAKQTFGKDNGAGAERNVLFLALAELPEKARVEIQRNKFVLKEVGKIAESYPLPQEWRSKVEAMLYPVSLFLNSGRFA